MASEYYLTGGVKLMALEKCWGAIDGFAEGDFEILGVSEGLLEG